MGYLLFLFLSAFSLGNHLENNQRITDLIGLLSTQDADNNIIHVEKISSRGCTNSIKCKKLYYLRNHKQARQDNGNDVFSISDMEKALSRIYSDYKINKDDEKLINVISIIANNIEGKIPEIQRRIYSIGTLLSRTRNYDLSFKVFEIGYHKYKDDANGYYFLLGLMKSKKLLLKNSNAFNQYICEFISGEQSNSSISSFIKFNYDYKKAIKLCKK